MEPVVAKIKGLGKDYIILAVTMLLQNLIDLGNLLGISGGLTGLITPSIPNNVAQVIKAVINGWSPATLLTAGTVNGMILVTLLEG